MRDGLMLYCIICYCVLCYACSIQSESSHVHHVGRFTSGDYPLIVLSPDFTIFAVNDTLPEHSLRFRDGRDFPLVGLLEVDGDYYRFWGRNGKQLKALAPIASDKSWIGKYTFLYPGVSWMDADYDDSHWLTGEGAFGTEYIDDIHTPWASRDIYVRREFSAGSLLSDSMRLYLRYAHDEAIDLYINGHQLLNTGYAWDYHGVMEIPSAVVETMKDTISIIAAHCNNLAGKGILDFGVYAEEECPAKMLSAKLVDVDMQATQSYYTFHCGAVELKLTVLTPYLVDDLDLASLPINFLTYEIHSLDGKVHNTKMTFKLGVEKAFGKNTLTFSQKEGVHRMKIGSKEQKLWVNKDIGKPSWGFFYWAMKGKDVAMLADKDGKFVSVVAKSFGVEKTSGRLLFAFDELSSLQYFGENLYPYWNKNRNRTMEVLLDKVLCDYPFFKTKCDQFDDNYMLKGYRLAGEDWAQQFLLPYRRLWSYYHLAADMNKSPICFADTVGNIRVAYDLGAVSLFWSSSTERVKALINPIFQYSESGKWGKDYPAYDVGVYPIAHTQANEGEHPVLSAANILLLTAAVARLENSPDYAREHWDVLTRWGDYLISNDSVRGVRVDSLLLSNTLKAKRMLGASAYDELRKWVGRKK